MSKAVLILEDGTIFEGQSFGALGEKRGEVVFHTGVVGYQELLTDPYYQGKILVMSYPLIGNYGIYDKGYESDRVQAQGLVVKENSKTYSNWQATGSLEDFMKKYDLVGIEGIDTRALVIHLRENGQMQGVISTEDFNTERNWNKTVPAEDLVEKVTTKKSYTLGKGQKVVLINLGVPKSLIQKLVAENCAVTVVPAKTSADNIFELNPKRVVLAGGPGDPRALDYVTVEVKKLLGKKPISGISLGTLILAQALGASVRPMKIGHHGVNQSVKNIKTGKAEVTVQNHNYVIDGDSIPKDLEITEINLNDDSIEGFCSQKYEADGVMYF